VVIVILALALAVLLVVQTGLLPIGSRPGKPGTTPEAGKAGQPAANDVPESASVGTQVQWKRPEPIGPVVSDPMRMTLPAAKSGTGNTAVPEVEPEFRVAGIVYSTEQPSSIIIDGQILHEGDSIHGATVVKITETYAELHRGDRVWQIRAGQTNREPK
jgi:hypothetical protein